jgi:hypothetical protein
MAVSLLLFLVEGRHRNVQCNQVSRVFQDCFAGLLADLGIDKIPVQPSLSAILSLAGTTRPDGRNSGTQGSRRPRLPPPDVLGSIQVAFLPSTCVRYENGHLNRADGV